MADMMTFPETWEEFEKSYGFDDSEEVYTNGSRLIPSFRVKQWLDHIAHRENERQATVSSDCVSRQAAIDAIEQMQTPIMRSAFEYEQFIFRGMCEALNAVKALPSAQSERTCVNCGRTVNNGGWYADGRTRCPIEEHYALPKDGYCHLWEKRNVTDDDYPERREE